MNDVIKIEQDLAKLSTLLKEYSTNSQNIEGLKKELRSQSEPLKAALERNGKSFCRIHYDKLSKVEIVDLIANVDTEQKDKIKRINSLIGNVNNHVYLLAQIVNNLMSFYNISYEDLKQCVKTIDDISTLIDERIDNTDRLSNQVGVLIRSQLQRVYNEGQQNDKIEKLYRNILYLKKQNEQIKLQLNKVANNTFADDANMDIKILQDIDDELFNAYNVDERIDEHCRKYQKHIQILWGLVLCNIFLIAFIVLFRIL